MFSLRIDESYNIFLIALTRIPQREGYDVARGTRLVQQQVAIMKPNVDVNFMSLSIEAHMDTPLIDGLTSAAFGENSEFISHIDDGHQISAPIFRAILDR